MKPFLKWAGNKYPIIQRIQAVLPEGSRLVEPFAGSAAVFLNTAYPKALLSDINGDLIRLYQILQKDGPAFIAGCRKLFSPETNREDAYYELRREFNATGNARRKAALFVYLNRHGYNGLCRYNASGGFNVPFGRYKQPYFPEKEMLHFHRKAAQAVFVSRDFTQVMKEAKPGDVVYCDPPYVPLTATANFTGYSGNGFGLDEQMALADLARWLAGRGIPVIISNHDTEFTQHAYHTARIIPFQVQRFISCRGDNRQPANEVLALFAG